MPRKNRRDDDHTRVRTRKARSEFAVVGALSYPGQADDHEDSEREPAAVGQRS
jgi:hypothetical protein